MKNEYRTKTKSRWTFEVWNKEGTECHIYDDLKLAQSCLKHKQMKENDHAHDGGISSNWHIVHHLVTEAVEG